MAASYSHGSMGGGDKTPYMESLKKGAEKERKATRKCHDLTLGSAGDRPIKRGGKTKGHRDKKTGKHPITISDKRGRRDVMDWGVPRRQRLLGVNSLDGAVTGERENPGSIGRG